jgi:hypothetical protein
MTFLRRLVTATRSETFWSSNDYLGIVADGDVADRTVLPELLHGHETRVWGDQTYRGQRAVIREHAPKARDFTNRRDRHRGVVDEGKGTLFCFPRRDREGARWRGGLDTTLPEFAGSRPLSESNCWER